MTTIASVFLNRESKKTGPVGMQFLVAKELFDTTNMVNTARRDTLFSFHDLDPRVVEFIVDNYLNTYPQWVRHPQLGPQRAWEILRQKKKTFINKVVRKESADRRDIVESALVAFAAGDSPPTWTTPAQWSAYWATTYASVTLMVARTSTDVKILESLAWFATSKFTYARQLLPELCRNPVFADQYTQTVEEAWLAQHDFTDRAVLSRWIDCAPSSSNTPGLVRKALDANLGKKILTSPMGYRAVRNAVGVADALALAAPMPLHTICTNKDLLDDDLQRVGDLRWKDVRTYESYILTYLGDNLDDVAYGWELFEKLVVDHHSSRLSELVVAVKQATA